MTRPWKILDSSESDEGPLELRQRGAAEFLITVAGRVLMNSAASRSELSLAEEACARIVGRAAPRVLVGGLGMGCTLRAALDALPADAQVIVAELDETILSWCRGPLALLTDRAVEDPRVEVRIGDVAEVIAEAARPGAAPYDAILLDLYEGPHPATQPRRHPHYGEAALARTRKALGGDPRRGAGTGALRDASPDAPPDAPKDEGRSGVLAVWSEDPDAAFEDRLARAGFAVERRRPGRGGRRHVVYVASAR
ncbi:MAG: spermidine synthase [Deltaproteobacteria bacterium]|nr:spermidine synthase [Deltaproteobacteria bacterium]MBW2418015.1 spermidine synthase [Deltaproteobacteria bacterium]